MTESFSKPVTPDGVTGMIFAAEGIRKTIVLLNGPMGCRFYHSTTSQFLSIHPLLKYPAADGQEIPIDYNDLNSWFFRQQRVPSTWLDGEDYVFGTAEKVREGLIYLRDHIAFDFAVIINAPGASLIGDRLEDMTDELLPDRHHLVMESPGFSTSFSEGYAWFCHRLVEKLTEKPVGGRGGMESSDYGSHRPRVNVIGLSIWDRYYEGDRQEIRRLLDMCGTEVNCFLASDCSLEEIRRIPLADANLVLDPSRGKETARYLEEVFGIPAFTCECLPIGFDRTMRLCQGLKELLKMDIRAVEEEEKRLRALAWYKINGIYQSSGLPTGAVFALEGSYNQVYAYADFLCGYLGMIPDLILVPDQMEQREEECLRQLMEKHHASGALTAVPEESKAEIVLGDANFIAAMTCRGMDYSGIEISYPGMGYTDLVPKTHLGLSGAMFLTEQILNGLMTRL